MWTAPVRAPSGSRLLEFGAGRHIDIRFGLMNYGPLDAQSPLAPHEIRVGIGGTSETVTGVREWLERCAAGVMAKQSPQPYLFPPFPAFGTDTTFAAKLVFADRLERTIHEREIINLARHGRARLIEEAVELFLAEMRHLVESAQPHVLVCALPWSLLDLITSSDDDDSAESALGGDKAGSDAGASEDGWDAPDFHHLLKARAMPFRTPIQLIKPSTYGNIRRGQGDDQVQDEATRAWNFFTALYYKVGGTPWRLTRDPSDLTTCHVGVAFYNTRDRETLSTSIAQVFNERGDGVIVRGAAATISKEDRQPHLAEEDAYQLLADALDLYRREHKNLPARVAAFKTSRHNAAELAGSSRRSPIAASIRSISSVSAAPPRSSSVEALIRRSAARCSPSTIAIRSCTHAVASNSSRPTRACTSRSLGNANRCWRHDGEGAGEGDAGADEDELEQHAVRRSCADHHPGGAPGRKHPQVRRPRRSARVALRQLHVVTLDRVPAASVLIGGNRWQPVATIRG
jgi:hypothetical protein